MQSVKWGILFLKTSLDLFLRAPPTPLSEQLDATQQFFAELFDFTVYQRTIECISSL